VAIWSIDDEDLHAIAEFGLVVFRSIDRWHHGVMLTAHLKSDQVIRLTMTPEQARLLKEELEKVLPFADRRDA
jgi:hypothetical protein